MPGGPAAFPCAVGGVGRVGAGNSKSRTEVEISGPARKKEKPMPQTPTPGHAVVHRPGEDDRQVTRPSSERG